MNRTLRRLVYGEEEARREKRQRLQQILRQRIADAAVAAAASAAPGGTAGPVATVSTEEGKRPAEEDDEYDDEVIEQQKLLASASAQWKCVEDSQQAMCIAMNRRETLVAIGEKDGRISIWDNTTIRVITKELDPTSIILPVEEGVGGSGVEAATGGAASAGAEEKDEENEENDSADEQPSRSKRQKTETTDETEQAEEERDEGSADGDSATNEDGSLGGNDDASVEADDDDDDGGTAMDVDDGASAEDNVSVDENAGDDQGDVDEDAGSMEVPAGEAVAASVLPRKLSEGSTQGLSMEELKIAKTMLKHVLSIVWSCDSRLLFAGCEEKSNRRGRLCVWEAESAWLLATFSFDGAVNSVSAHPRNPDLVVVCTYSSLPVLVNVKTREMTELPVPVENPTLTVTPPPNSRHPSLVVCCRYGASGRYIYCATSKSTVAILDSETLECVDVKLLPILIQFVDLAVNFQETALAFTSSKGIHEFAIRGSDGGYVVGMPIVRHRHVGESGLYTWHRATGRVQHNLGVKDGVSSICWSVGRDALLAVSCAGAIHVLEEEFKTEWPGTMYPAGFRLVTDNELDMEALERELGEQDLTPLVADDALSQKCANGTARAVDIFTLPVEKNEQQSMLPLVNCELWHIPSIPITQHVKRHFHHDFHIERHFGLGQSVFEPLKAAIKKPVSGSSSKKKKKSGFSSGAGSTQGQQQPTQSGKSKSKSKSGNSKKRRR